MKEKRCLVTGGNGFVGSHLVEALAAEGWRVRVLDRNLNSTLNLDQIADRIEIMEGDFGNRETARSALHGVDALFHYASTTTPASAQGQSIFDVTTNLVGTIALLEEAAACGVQRLFFASSGGTVYGPASEVPTPETYRPQPICSHGIVKLAIEHFVQLYSRERGIRYTILRYANPYGPRQNPEGTQGVAAVFMGRILANRPILLWGDGDVVRDFLYIGDLVRATLIATRADSAINEVFNIGSGEGTSIRSLLSQIEYATGVPAKIEFSPPRSVDVPTSILAIDKARTDLGWSPSVPLNQGLAHTLVWMKSYLGSRQRAKALALRESDE